MTTGRFGDDELIPSEATTAGEVRQSVGAGLNALATLHAPGGGSVE